MNNSPSSPTRQDNAVTTPSTPGQTGSGQPTWVGLVLILLVASCLRPAITAVGPVIESIGETTGLSAPQLGLLGTLPLLCFAVISPIVPHLGTRFGVRRVVLWALGGLTVGIALRSVDVPGALWAGTLIIGVGIAVGNVLVPALAKREFANRAGFITGIYTAVMAGAASLASGISEPLSHGIFSSWRPGLGMWAIPAALATLGWAIGHRGARKQRGSAGSGEAPPATVPWRSGLAWSITLFLGLQSLVFYTMINWLPTMVMSRGYSGTQAGWYLFYFQTLGIIFGPIATTLADKFRTQSWICASAGVFIALGCIGAFIAPDLVPVWVTLVGIGSGASFPLSLTLIAMRASTPEAATGLSGMAQSFGYAVAALGPFLAGALYDMTGGWAAVVAMILITAVGQSIFSWIGGRPALVDAPDVVARMHTS